MSVALPQGTEDAKARPSLAKQRVSLDTESIRVYVSSVASRMRDRVTMDTLRPLPMFLGVTGPSFCLSAGAFTPPTSHMDRTATEKIRGRIRLNFLFFLSNYAFLTFGVAIVVSLLHPGMLFFLGILWGLWSLHEFLISNELLVFGRNLSVVMTISQRSLLLTIVTFIVIVWKCLFPFLVVLVVSGLMVLSHATMRDPKHIESSKDFRHRGGSADSDDESASNESGEMVERGDVV